MYGFFNSVRRFLAGRNGVDALAVALMVIGGIVTFAMSFVSLRYLRLLGYIPYVLAVMRIVSVNVEKRRKENEAFLRFIAPWKKYAEKKIRQQQDVDHKYYNCPQCNRTLRVPKGRGKIKISCPHCSKEFTRRT